MNVKASSYILQIQHLSKTFGQRQALIDLNLKVSPGDIHGFTLRRYDTRLTSWAPHKLELPALLAIDFNAHQALGNFIDHQTDHLMSKV